MCKVLQKRDRFHVLWGEQGLTVLQLLCYKKWVVSLSVFSRPHLTLFISFILSLSNFFSKLIFFLYRSNSTSQTICLCFNSNFSVALDKGGHRFGQVCLAVSWESCCSDAFLFRFSPNLTFQRWLLQQDLPLYSPDGKSALAFISCSKKKCWKKYPQKIIHFRI